MDEWMKKQMNEQMNVRMNELLNKQSNEGLIKWIKEQKKRLNHVHHKGIYEWLNEYYNEWMNEQINEPRYVFVIEWVWEMTSNNISLSIIIWHFER